MHRRRLASFPGLLTPAFITSTDAGGGLVILVTCSDVQGRWACGGVEHSFCTAAGWLSGPEKCHQDCLMSTAQSLSGSWMQLLAHSLAVFQECATPPHVTCPPSKYQFYTRPCPALVLQATNAGVRRSGYEASRR